jgi:hypothetical protein
MFRRASPALLVALGTACAGISGFTEAPHLWQIVALVMAAILAAMLERIATPGVHFKKTDVPVAVAVTQC